MDHRRLEPQAYNIQKMRDLYSSKGATRYVVDDEDFDDGVMQEMGIDIEHINNYTIDLNFNDKENPRTTRRVSQLIEDFERLMEEDYYDGE